MFIESSIPATAAAAEVVRRLHCHEQRAREISLLAHSDGLVELVRGIGYLE